ncbi:MAG: hypothetical protein AB1776_08395 [Bacillota bacterium]
MVNPEELLLPSAEGGGRRTVVLDEEYDPDDLHALPLRVYVSCRSAPRASCPACELRPEDEQVPDAPGGVLCPECDGSGLTEEGGDCPACGGFGSTPCLVCGGRTFLPLDRAWELAMEFVRLRQEKGRVSLRDLEALAGGEPGRGRG